MHTHVQNGKDDIRDPSYTRDSQRRDLHHDEGEDPIRRRGYARPFLSEPQGEDFGRVHPDGGLEADGESALEDEQHDCTGDSGCVYSRCLELDLIDERGLDGHHRGHEGYHGEQFGVRE